MILTRRLIRDQRGAAVVEMALALPLLVSIIFGIYQLALLFFANAGMQHALGEGARFATLYSTARNVTVTDNSKSPAVVSTRAVNYPTKADVKTRITSELFGRSDGTFTVDDPIGGTSSTTIAGLDDWYDLRITYKRKLDFIFMKGPTITLVRTKRVYLAIS